MDATDRSIIRELQADGRISYADLAPRVGLSAPATRQRVQRLVDSELLQVVAVTDPLKLGLPVMALVGITVDGDVRAVADRVSELDRIIYVVLTSGSFDLFAEVVCADMDELFAVVNDHIRAIDGVRTSESFVYFDIHTHRFTWDVPD
ncbi:MAG: Lrp/AsnC family transcriptional regulator [Actinomycetota bacterium]|nr:Lrp/AsnC family transcriptional regulator [Actinomycetota bacterium]MDH4352353.1 Lrp/AsnC family transcriptional regulator [Actinomycetota bacterium]MDH5277660.1 Lrp/AsnC family transcriptional regulator [Actinomycetota bacterium]